MGKTGKVYVVCAFDTEGPINDPRKPDILHNWQRVDSLIDRLISPECRRVAPDSHGNGLVYSWFILHLTGFRTNPFDRPMGYHAVFDHYLERYGQQFRSANDGIYWHYHHPAPSGVGNEWCRDWTHCSEYHNILAHMVIDRGFFPSCFRAGGRIEDNDLSNWIEQWIPFDFSNNSGNVNWEKIESDGKRLRDVCDWTRASLSWIPYHPSFHDYQAAGHQRRFLFRCPDLDSPVHQLSDGDIHSAFREAAEGSDVVLAFFEHDRRDNVLEKVKKVACRIADTANEYPAVSWLYSNAEDAARMGAGLEIDKPPEFELTLRDGGRVAIECKNKIFTERPFVCALMKDGYEEIPVNVIGVNHWLTGRIRMDSVCVLGAAACSPGGIPGCSSWKLDPVKGSFIAVKTKGCL